MLSLLSSSRPLVLPRSSKRSSMTCSVVLMKRTNDDSTTCVSVSLSEGDGAEGALAHRSMTTGSPPRPALKVLFALLVTALAPL